MLITRGKPDVVSGLDSLASRAVCWLHRILQVGRVAAAGEVKGVVDVPLAADRLTVVVAAGLRLSLIHI